MVHFSSIVSLIVNSYIYADKRMLTAVNISVALPLLLFFFFPSQKKEIEEVSF